MASFLILVNGLPGSGKTTLSRQLGGILRLPVISKDVLKEALAETTGGCVSGGRLGQIASDTMWQLAAAVPGAAVVESWWYRPRDLEHARRGAALSGAPAIAEVWCDVLAETARVRYERRVRHPIHTMDPATADATWAEWWEHGAPLELGTTIRVDTEAAVDLAGLADLLRAAMERPGSVTPG
ncbi:AAA family ATPase [Pseudarthrobacter sp. L19]|uniref:AAA family ATPase n=1 Tax=Pseudarthrobacter sp. L19 TaxID=3423951 RepID=UPI003D7A6ED2